VWKSQVLEGAEIYCVVFSPQNDLVALLGGTRFGLLDDIPGATVFKHHPDDQLVVQRNIGKIIQGGPSALRI